MIIYKQKHLAIKDDTRKSRLTFAAPAVSSTASLTNPNLVNVFSHWARAYKRPVLDEFVVERDNI